MTEWMMQKLTSSPLMIELLHWNDLDIIKRQRKPTGLLVSKQVLR
jgi:hypothetical protein